MLENFKNKKKRLGSGGFSLLFKGHLRFYRGIMTRLPPSIMIGCIFYQMAAVRKLSESQMKHFR